MKTFKLKGRLAVLCCAAAVFSSGALFFGYPGILDKYWQKLFSAGTDATGLVMTFALFGVGIMMFCVGNLQRIMGSQACILIGNIILACAMLLLNFTSDLRMVYLWAFLVGMGNSFIYVPTLTVVQNWFPQCRGLVTGIVNVIFGLAAAVMSPVISLMLNHLGYKAMNLVIIAIIAIVGIIIFPFVGMPTRRNLSDAEWEAYQNTLSSLKTQDNQHGPSLSAVSVSPLGALRTMGFWSMWLTWCFMGAAGISMVSLSTGYASSLGISGVVVLTSFNLTNGLSRFVAGTLSDRIGRNLTGSAAFLLGAVGYFFLPMAHGIAAVSVLAAFVGFAFGTLFAVSAPLTSDLFGLKYFSVIFGMIFTAYGLVGGIVGPALAGHVLSVTGSNFSIVFRYLSLFCLLAAALVLLARHRAETVRS